MKRFLAVCLVTFVCSSVESHASGPSDSRHQPKPQEVYAAYWTAEPGWHTELQIRNNYAAETLEVQVVLRTANGSEIPLPTVTLGPDDDRVLDVGSILASAAPQLRPEDAYGSVIFRYSSRGRGNLFANVMVHRQGQPIGFHFDAYGVDAKAMQSEESLWWLPRESTQGFILIANVSRSNATARLRVSAPDGTGMDMPVRLGPGEMRRLSLRELAPQLTATAQFGGLSLAGNPPGALTVNAIEYDDTVGFAANLTVFDRGTAGPAETTTIRAPMVALARPAAELGFPESLTLQPQVLVRNPTPLPISVTRVVNWKSATQTGSAASPPVLLAPGETRSLALAPDEQVPANANWATVALTYDGHYGDLVAIFASYSADSRYGVQSPFSPNLAPIWKGSRWTVDDTHDSLITAGNGGNKPTRLGVTVYYNGGSGKYIMPPRSLAPREQVWLDMAHLILDQVPDVNGRTLPIDLTSGSYQLEDLDDADIGSIYEGKLTIDRTYGQAAYGCSLCCGYEDSWIAPMSFTGNVGDSTPDAVWAQYCTGVNQDKTSVSYGWGSSNSSVANVSFAFTSLVGPGSADTLASVNLKEPSGPKTCAVIAVPLSAGVTSKPTISGPNTIWWFEGQSPAGYATSITLTSSGGTSTTWAVTAGGDKVSLSSTSGSSITVTSTGTAFSSAPADITITATANGQTSSPFSITTRKPDRLASPQTRPFCDSFYGYSDMISYEIRDQLNTVVPTAITWNEQFTSPCLQDNPQGNWCSYGLPTESGDVGTILVDMIQGPGLNNTTPPNPTPVCVGDSTQQQHWAQEFWVGSATPGVGVRVQTDNLVRFTNHAEHQNIVSPTP